MTERFWGEQKIISWLDIAKSVGSLALESTKDFITKRHVSEPTPSMSEHYHGSQPEPES